MVRPSDLAPDKQTLRIAIDLDTMIDRHMHPALDQPANRCGIGLVLNGQYAISQDIRCITRPDRDAALRDDGSVIQHRRHKMHGTSVQLHSRRQRLSVRMQAREHGQQRGMNIHQPAGVVIHKPRGQDAHETSQQHIIRLVPVDFLGQGRIESFPAREILVIQRAGGDALFARP